MTKEQALSQSLAVGTAAKQEDAPEEAAAVTLDEQQQQQQHRRSSNIRRASVQLAVDQKPDVTLTFENLTVHVPAETRCCRTTSSNILDEPFTAIQNVSGVLAPGEMLLVLGSNDIATSALIRAVTARLSPNDDVSGTILVNGCPLARQAWQGWRRIAAYVSSSDATHAAVLTVRETLEFAAQCTSDGTKSQEYIDTMVEEMLEQLDLAHVGDTVVGDENLRGISGGQKRRVTVGEMLVSENLSFLGLENITDGLSSEDSFNLIQRLQRACKSYRISSMISLLQPSDEIVELFDKILVLTDEGQMAYYGPIVRQTLRQVFLSEKDNNEDPDNSSDSGSICDLVLRKSAESDEIRRRFAATQASMAFHKKLEEVRSSRSLGRDAYSFLPKTKYACDFKHQFRFIAKRRLKLIARNAVTYTRIGIAIVFGCIIGSLFSGLFFDISGSLSRTGYLFLNCFLVLMLSAAITIPQTFRDRVTLYKHRTAEFYSARVAYYTQVLLDIPLAVLEAVLLAGISYYWVKLNPPAKNFFYFVGVLIGLEFFGQAFGRFLCAVTRKQVYANTLSSIFLLIFGTVAGFMPSYDAIPAVLAWLSWLTPASYAFEGIMLNEFVGQNISFVTLTTGLGEVSVGELTGEQWLGLTGIPREPWTSPTRMKGFDIFMLFFLSVVFDLLGSYYTERRRDIFFNQIRRPQKTTKSTRFYGTAKPSATTLEKGADSQTVWPTSLTVQNVSYYVPLPGKHRPKRCSVHSIMEPLLVRIFGKTPGREEELKVNETRELRLLDSIHAKFGRGKMTALMGTSGAGKTTLLDVIAGYKTGGRIDGSVMIGGVAKDNNVWKSISAYAEQNDILNPYLSALETLRFTAACRLPRDVDKDELIDDIVRIMGLEDDLMNMVVGREIDDEGLPKHARKRLTIAVQLVTRPKILFADEPTTMLGTTSANLVIDALRRCTDELGLITVATIHQPSKQIWDAFDDLLLLVAGGRTAYMGEMGVGSQKVIHYFENLSGEKYSQQINPADFILSTVARLDADEVVSAFERSEPRKALLDGISSLKGASNTDSAEVERIRKEAARGKSLWKETALLTKRHFMTQWRNTSYSSMRVVASTLISLYMGILFVGNKSGIEGAVYSIGAIFFLVFVLVIPMQASVVPLIEDRAVLYREATSGMYSRLSYGLGQLLADIPFHLINTLMMFVTFYFLVGFRREGDLIGYFILLLFMSNWVVMSLGQLFALATPNEESANGLAGLSVILSVILMGFLITVSAMPSGWVWAYWSNLFHYIIQGLVTNELSGKNYTLIAPLTLEELASSSGNITNAMIFSPGTDVSPGSVASQSSAFYSLVENAGPGNNYNWTTSGIVAVAALLDCMVENKCLVEPIFVNFMDCCVFRLFGKPPCKGEFENALERVNVTEVAKCFDSDPSSQAPSTGNSSAGSSVVSLPRGFPDTFTLESFESMGEVEQAELVLCLLRALLPPGFFDDVLQDILEIINTLFDIGMVVLDIIENGLALPGEVILYVFGWAVVTPGGLEAPFKWFYCLFSVAMFLVGIELMKLAAVRFVVWTKR